LRAEVGRRQQLLAEAGHASLAEYRQAGHRLPWLVFMLDRWEGFVAAFEGYDYGRLIEALLQLLREGPAVGLRAVITSDRPGLLQMSRQDEAAAWQPVSPGAGPGARGRLCSVFGGRLVRRGPLVVDHAGGGVARQGSVA